VHDNSSLSYKRNLSNANDERQQKMKTTTRYQLDVAPSRSLALTHSLKLQKKKANTKSQKQKAKKMAHEEK